MCQVISETGMGCLLVRGCDALAQCGGTGTEQVDPVSKTLPDESADRKSQPERRVVFI